MAYQRAGLAIALASSTLVAATYLLLGPCPLLALWIGLTVVGLSMALTPPEPRAGRVSRLVLDSLENVERLLEALGIGSEALYVPTNRGVYALIGPRAPSPRELDPDRVSERLFVNTGSGSLLAIKIPLPSFESSDVCSAIEEVVVDSLDLASWIECSFDGRRLGARFHSAKAVGFAKTSRALGTVQSIMAAAILARIAGRATRVAEDRREGSDVVTIVEVVEDEGG